MFCWPSGSAGPGPSAWDRDGCSGSGRGARRPRLSALAAVRSPSSTQQTPAVVTGWGQRSAEVGLSQPLLTLLGHRPAWPSACPCPLCWRALSPSWAPEASPGAGNTTRGDRPACTTGPWSGREAAWAGWVLHRVLAGGLIIYPAAVSQRWE